MMGPDLARMAAALAEDGEIGNSDAIALLQVPHSPVELRVLIETYRAIMTPQALGKLAVAMHAPLPHGVSNQRYEPIFDRHPVTGRTHTTAAGQVTLTEVQYYNGRMMHLYGECTRPEEVDRELAGSGYRALRVDHGDGRRRVLAQVWAQLLTDTSIRPYDSGFFVIPVVPRTISDRLAVISAQGSGAGSVMAMLRGRHEPAAACYCNDAALYFARLYDTTQVAIDVGRERMGTDKRPGFVELVMADGQLHFALRDGKRRLAIRGDIPLAHDAAAFLSSLERCARDSGVTQWRWPAGTEHVYPALARIEQGPLHAWEWRTDLTPRLFPVPAGSVHLSDEAEEGAMLRRWGFEARAMGFIPNVRGAITGLDRAPPKPGDSSSGPEHYRR